MSVTPHSSLERPGSALGRCGVPFLVAVVSAAPVSAQLPDFPTLSDAGLEYISDSGFLQLLMSGQLDLEGFHVASGLEPIPSSLTNCETCHVGIGRGIREGEGALNTLRLRVFADIFLGDHLYSLVEIRGDGGGESLNASLRGRIEQAYVRASTESGSTGLQVGRFASPFGSYPMRHLTIVDPFIRPPLAYDYRTVMNRWSVPSDAQAFLSWKDTPLRTDLPGAPPVWEVPYQWGAMAFGRLGPIDLRFAAMNSSPSSGPSAWGFDWSRFERPSWVASARMKPSASLEMGVSYNRGPWMQPTRTGTILPPPGSPPGTPVPGWRDFDQELFSVDFGFARGPIMLRGEVIFDHWAVPNVETKPKELSYSLEGQWDLGPGFFIAARGGLIDFMPLENGSGSASTDWDHDVRRYEGSVGYRLARNVGVLFAAFTQSQNGATDGDTDQLGLRMWWAF